MIYALFQFEIDVKTIGIFPTTFIIINADMECDPFLWGVKNIHSKIEFVELLGLRDCRIGSVTFSRFLFQESVEGLISNTL